MSELRHLVDTAKRCVDTIESQLHEANMHLTPLLEAAKNQDMEDLADCGFLMREMADTLDDLRKECNARKDIISTILAVRMTRDFLDGASTEMITRGELASATPDVKVEPMIPKAGTPEYASMCKALGVSQEMIETGVLKPHYKHLSTWLTERVEKALPTILEIPTRTTTSCIYRKKRS